MIKLCWMFARLAGVAATVVAAFLLLNQVPVRGQQTPVQIPDTVLAAAGQGQLVRIIVGVRVDNYRPEGDLAGPAAAAQRADVANRVDQVVGRLNAVVQRPVRRFDTIPFFATVVDLNALLQLQIDPDVASIEEDEALRPSLAQSVPLIGAPAAWAAGYTGAGWTVAILDTGVEKTHPFLSGKVVSEACYSNAGGIGGAVTTCPDGTTASTAVGSGVNCAAASAGAITGRTWPASRQARTRRFRASPAARRSSRSRCLHVSIRPPSAPPARRRARSLTSRIRSPGCSVSSHSARHSTSPPPT